MAYDNPTLPLHQLLGWLWCRIINGGHQGQHVHCSIFWWGMCGRPKQRNKWWRARTRRRAPLTDSHRANVPWFEAITNVAMAIDSIAAGWCVGGGSCWLLCVFVFLCFVFCVLCFVFCVLCFVLCSSSLLAIGVVESWYQQNQNGRLVACGRGSSSWVSRQYFWARENIRKILCSLSRKQKQQNKRRQADHGLTGGSAFDHDLFPPPSPLDQTISFPSQGN